MPLLQQHPLAGGIPAPDSGRSRPSRSSIPVQTNFSGAVYAPDTRLRASPVQVSNPRIWFVFPGTGRPDHGHTGLLRHFSKIFYARCLSEGAGGGGAATDRPTATLYCRHPTNMTSWEQRARLRAARFSLGWFGCGSPGTER